MKTNKKTQQDGPIMTVFFIYTKKRYVQNSNQQKLLPSFTKALDLAKAKKMANGTYRF
jgi:hypothetical protein